MKNGTYKKWTRDALETKHQLKHESDAGSLLLKQFANRIIALADELRILKTLQERKD